MPILSLPPSPKIATIDWTLTQPTQANRSEFTGARRVTVLAIAPRWSAKIKFVRAFGEANVKALRAFLGALQGQAGRFYLRLTENVQASATGGAVVVDGAGQTGYTMTVKGWAPGASLAAGDFVTVTATGQPLQLVAPVVADGNGKAALQFVPYLRAVPANASPIEVLRPYAVMSLTADAAGWSVSPGQVYDVSIECEEAA